MQKLSDPRENNFNILRLVAASAVIFSHAVDLTTGHHDFLAEKIGYSGGWIAVSAFFSISGMLIYKSIVRSRSVREYMTARSLRIFPGLWVMLILTTLFLGPAISTLSISEYFTSSQLPEYFFGNAILYVPRYFLPGVFESNPLTAVNGSLWTLRFEFTCYLITLLLFLIGAYRTETTFRIMCAIIVAGYLGYLGLGIVQGTLDQVLYDGSDIAKLHRMFFAFFVGIIVGHYIDQIRPKAWWVVLSGAATWISFGTPLFATALIIFIALAVFWFAFLQQGWLVPFRQMQDYSYGIYIYGFPVQQTTEHFLPGLSSLGNALLSLAVTLPFAAASWHFVEKPALGLKARLLTKRGTA